MVAAVSPWASDSGKNQFIENLPNVSPDTKSPAGSSVPRSTSADLSQAREATKPAHRNRSSFVWISAIALGLAIAFAFVLHARWANADRKTSAAIAPQPQKSIAVLPFLDLTQGMKEEEFADGMTEELIDKLSKIPGLRVPSPTSSFYFKDKQIPVADIARLLGVAYVVDGSVRKSGTRLRVAARLIRADNGYVVWTESYDRPLTDRLMVQDDIAGEVAKALNASTEFKPR
jgi:TolB-like protein